MRAIVLPLLVALCASFTSCACSILPKADAVRDKFYVLVADPGPPAGDPLGKPTTLVVARVTVPAYLDRAELVTRTEDNQISLQRNERWAEPLVEALPRILAADLAALLATSNVAVSTHGGTASELTLLVDVQRFERNTKGQVEIRALWSLQDPLHGVVKSGETNLSEPAAPAEGGAAPAGEPDGEATAAALSQGLRKLALAIGTAVREAKH